jgi:hypothetical protein
LGQEAEKYGGASANDVVREVEVDEEKRDTSTSGKSVTVDGFIPSVPT